jgi:hypothetical protein
MPTLRLNLDVQVESGSGILFEPSRDVVCDFVDNFALGDAIGVGIRSPYEWATVKAARLLNGREGR